MKQFLEKLEEHKKKAKKPQATEATLMFRNMQNKYQKLVGVRALMLNPHDQESRVVRIEKVYSHFLVVSYGYYGIENSGRIDTCILYSSIITGEYGLVMDK